MPIGREEQHILVIQLGLNPRKILQIMCSTFNAFPYTDDLLELNEASEGYDVLCVLFTNFKLYVKGKDQEIKRLNFPLFTTIINITLLNRFICFLCFVAAFQQIKIKIYETSWG